MNKQKPIGQVIVYISIAIFLTACEPYQTNYIEKPIWSDNDISIVYVAEHATNYYSLAHSYHVDRSEVFLTNSQSVAGGTLLFEEDEFLSVSPLYFSEQHQILIYQAGWNRDGPSTLRTFNLTDNTKQVSELDFGYFSKAPLSPNAEWIAVYQSSTSQESELNTISMVFVRTDDLQKSVAIQSNFSAQVGETPLYHWQGNDSVWVSHASGYVVFNLMLESATEQMTGCIEPSADSSGINSQGVKVSVGHNEEDDLRITQGSPIYFCNY